VWATGSSSICAVSLLSCVQCLSSRHMPYAASSAAISCLASLPFILCALNQADLSQTVHSHAAGWHAGVHGSRDYPRHWQL
jgi:hypothetical protein